MGIGDKIKRARREQEEAERAARQALAHAIQTHPDRAKSRLIIPVIEPILRELASTAKLMLIRKTDFGPGDVDGKDKPLIRYTFNEKVGSWLFAKPGDLVGYVKIGTLENANNLTTLRVIPLSVWVPGYGTYNQTSYAKNYSFSEIPDDAGQMREWLVKEMFYLYNSMKSAKPRVVR